VPRQYSELPPDGVRFKPDELRHVGSPVMRTT
jgi:hypothetical protein